VAPSHWLLTPSLLQTRNGRQHPTLQVPADGDPQHKTLSAANRKHTFSMQPQRCMGLAIGPQIPRAHAINPRTTPSKSAVVLENYFGPCTIFLDLTSTEDVAVMALDMGNMSRCWRHRTSNTRHTRPGAKTLTQSRG
jgi:hypothetical protein